MGVGWLHEFESVDGDHAGTLVANGRKPRLQGLLAINRSAKRTNGYTPEI